MQTAHVDRNYFIGAIAGAAPHLRPYFEGLLIKASYTVEELNTMFRYELIKLSNNTIAIRDWLGASESVDIWLHHFCQHVVPFLSRHLHHQYESLDSMLSSLSN